jgi:hypothetical protein
MKIEVKYTTVPTLQEVKITLTPSEADDLLGQLKNEYFVSNSPIWKFRNHLATQMSTP